MRKAILFLISLAVLNACTSNGKHSGSNKDTTAVLASVPAPDKAADTVSRPCEAGQTLVYEEPDVFSTYTEDKMRGSGIVSFQFEINDRLDIFYPDLSTFGFLLYNEDGSYYTMDMPKKLLARRVVPQADFAQFDFDAEAIDTDKDYLIIYANKKKLMVKKAGIKYTYQKWDDYVRSQTIELKDCNLLNGSAQYKDMAFDVTQVDGDRIKIKSNKDCDGPDGKFTPAEGWVTWKKDGNLLIDFGTCD
ncbi:hypothetical protein ACVWYN_002218 [Pedobacter sp. UYP24]